MLSLHSGGGIFSISNVWNSCPYFTHGCTVHVQLASISIKLSHAFIRESAAIILLRSDSFLLFVDQSEACTAEDKLDKINQEKIIGESDTIDTIECLARACMYPGAHYKRVKN